MAKAYFYALFSQFPYHFVQRLLPEASEALKPAEPADDGGADSLIGAGKGSPGVGLPHPIC